MGFIKINYICFLASIKLKRILSIFLLTTLLFPVFGTLFLFKYQQKMLRREIKAQIVAGLDEEDLVLFVFSEKEKELLDWKHDKEFSFRGVMYDIVKQKNEHGNYYYWCWKDDKETTLHLKLEQLFANAYGKDSKNQQQKVQLNLFNKTLFIPVVENWKPIFSLVQIVPPNFHYFFSEKSLFLPPNSPPPLFV